MAADLWSCGALFFLLLSGQARSYHEDQYKLIEAIKDCAPTIRSWQHVSPDAKDLIQKLLTRDPIKRINAEKIRTHSWLLCSTPHLEKTNFLKFHNS